MEKIKLEYQPFPFLKYTSKINGEFPSDFSELMPKQFIAIQKFINQKISETMFLESLTGIKGSTINKLNNYCRYRLMQLFEPFLEVKPHSAFIIPEIKTSGKIFCSPKLKLSGVTFAQFIFIESYFSDYQTDKNPVDLYKFIASLYLEQNHNFDENEISLNASTLSHVKPEILEAIVINYVLIREWLARSYPIIFQQEEETDDQTKPKTHKNPGNSGWIKIFENIVGDDLINHDRYALLPLHNVLRWMTVKIVENIKRK